ncbi:MAG: CRISPR-associated endonuclease Cas2 [Candidatus Colwellbacteria bacterium]
MQRGDLTKRILEHLMDASSDIVYIFAAIVASPYGSSRKHIERKMRELREGGATAKLEIEKIKQKQQNFYSMLYQLEKEGFIKKTKDRKLLITVLGKEKYKKILSRLPKRHHKPQADTSLKVVIFDIPEKEKHKRGWLRDQLRDLGFKMIQKSVWMGKKKIPKEFLEDIKDLNLLAYIEIFAITKTGSIRSVK